VRIAVEAAANADAAAVLLVGDQPYYGPLGFSKMPRGQVSLPRPVDLDRILVAELRPGAAAALKGMVDHEDRIRAALSLLPGYGDELAQRAG
jgi:predicted N-acetyltransferase YhbS